MVVFDWACAVLNDSDYMTRAIGLARNGWYTTMPNPRVGCVVVRDGEIIGEGWHEKAGQAHAEIRALSDVQANGANARGATVYVTLEPCSHHGKTPPCADALIAADVSRVVVGATDPNPKIDGRGIARLREARIDVTTGVEQAACEALNPGFNHHMRTGRPRLRIKLAMTLDGRSAAADGESQWITGSKARDDVHRLRAESGAVMIGSGTALADDPSLTVRLAGAWHQPDRVVLDSQLCLPPTARMLTLPGQTHVFTACGEDAPRWQALADAGAQLHQVDATDSGLNLQQVLSQLHELQYNDVLVEAGPTLAGALVQQHLADEIIIYMAPQLLGDTARGLLTLPGAQTLADRVMLEISDVQPVGGDWRILARLTGT